MNLDSEKFEDLLLHFHVQITLGVINFDDIKRAALNQLNMGVFDDYIYQLSNINELKREDIIKIFDAYLDIKKIKRLSIKNSIFFYATYISKLILENKIDALKGAEAISRIVAKFSAEIGDFHDLDEFIYAWSDYDRSPTFFSQCIKKSAIALTRKGLQPL